MLVRINNENYDLIVTVVSKAEFSFEPSDVALPVTIQIQKPAYKNRFRKQRETVGQIGFSTSNDVRMKCKV